LLFMLALHHYEGCLMKPALPSMQMYEGHRSRKMHSLKDHCRQLLSHLIPLFFPPPGKVQ